MLSGALLMAGSWIPLGWLSVPPMSRGALIVGGHSVYQGKEQRLVPEQAPSTNQIIGLFSEDDFFFNFWSFLFLEGEVKKMNF